MNPTMADARAAAPAAHNQASTSAAARLLVLTELFLPTKGGTAVWFDAVYRLLGGRDIHIVTAEVPGASEHDHDHPNTVHRLRLKRHWWLKPESLGMYAKLLARSLSLVRSTSFTAVHAGRVLPEGLVGLIAARARRLPLVVYAHGEEITTWRQPLKLRAMAYTYRHADKVIANSEFTARELRKLGVAADRITLISPGVDVDRFRPGLACDDLRQQLGISGNAKLVLSVGRLSPRKGFDHTIRAVARLRNSGMDVVYAIIGSGEDRPRLLTIAGECNVAPCVHLLGHVLPDDLPRWYNAADVFAMPNRSIAGDTEGFGMVFLEAGACGKAVVAGDDGGTADAVVDGVTGFRVNGEDVQSIANALQELLDNPVACRRMGETARRRVLEQFSWQHVASLTRDLNESQPKH
ncbi:MAG TPA: glycosyltransferase family 4 protein [Burkholderiales bacterium]|nr:glycosyltransferase family 4 protein [Burkholderiales bacterium]